MKSIIIGLGLPGLNTVNSMFANDNGENNFLNVDGNECYIQTSIAPTLLLEERIFASEAQGAVMMTEDKITKTLKGNDIIFLAVWPHDLIGFGMIAFPRFVKIAQKLQIPVIGLFISSSTQYHKLEKIRSVVEPIEKEIFASMRIMLDSFCKDLPSGLSTNGLMYDIVGPGLLQSVKTLASIIDSHNIALNYKSIGVIKTGYGIAKGENGAVMAMSDALINTMIDFERLKAASKIWIISSSSQILSDTEKEDMQLILEATLGTSNKVFWRHIINIELYDNFEVSIIGSGNRMLV